ncbi:hypothetical protein L204_101820 [Cryptococcus depauperatus]
MQNRATRPPSRTLQTLPAAVPDLDSAGIGIWQGRTVFLETSLQAKNSLSTEQQTFVESSNSLIAAGSSSSPISDSFSPASRVRAAVRYSSPLSRTAYEPLLTTPRPSFPTPNQKPIHPFFTSQKPFVPTPTRPRLVAHYSSAESESESSKDGNENTLASDYPSQQNKALENEDIVNLMNKVEDMRIVGPTKVVLSNPNTTKTTARRPLAKAQTLQSLSQGLQSLNDGVELSMGTSQGETPRPSTHSLSKAYNPKLTKFHFLTYPRPPTVVYTRSITEADDLIGCLKGSMVGFDIEWPMKLNKKWNRTTNRYEFQQGRTAMVQLCDEKLIILIHLETTMDLPPKLIDLIRDPKVYKLGVNSKGDGQKLIRDFPQHFPEDKGPSSLLELSWMAKAVDPDRAGYGRTLIALSVLCRGYLGRELDKDPNVRQSDWSRELNVNQREYAANDVFVSIQLFYTFQRLAQERNIKLHLDHYSTTLGMAYSKPLSSYNTTGETLDTGLSAALAAISTGVKPPTPAKMTALNAFLLGHAINDIATTKSIKNTSVMHYILDALLILRLDFVKPNVRRRLWHEVDYPIWKLSKFKSLHGQLLAENGEHPAQNEKQSPNQNDGYSVTP